MSLNIPKITTSRIADSFGIFCILTLYKGFSDLYRIAVISGISGNMGVDYQRD